MTEERGALEFEELTELADKVAKSKAREYPGIEAEDIRQEILVRVLESPDSLTGFGGGALRRTFEAVATRYCATERYRYTFHSGQYVYTPDEVRALFEEAFYDPGAWEHPPVKESYELSITSGGVVVALWDLREAFGALKPAEKEVIEARYRNGFTLTETERKRCNRAIDSATRILNRRITEKSTAPHNGPGARRAISNAEAVARTKESYD